MTADPIRTAFPNLCTLLVGSNLEADISAVLSFVQEGEESLRDALEGNVFTLNQLMWLLAGTVVPGLADPAGPALEANLTTVIQAVGTGPACAAYRDKLLVDDRNKLEDTQYELAAAAKACAVLDPGSIQLEKPIPDSRKKPKDWKNTDISGAFQGQPVCIEVTVLHESLPAAVQAELDALVRAADVTSGFSVNLRYVLADQGHAERARALIELLHECHVASGGADQEIDGVRFEWRKGSCHCEQGSSPIVSVVFHDANDFPGADQIREVIHPCTVRNLTPMYILEDHPNPPGVVTLADLPDTPKGEPPSTKVHQMLAGKLLQCEPGVVNIVAYGTPLPMNDKDVEDALLGVATAGFQGGRARLLRDPKAPFVPAQHLANDDDRGEFVEPFRKLSGVWQLRLGSHARSVIFENPNAMLPIPPGLATALPDPPDESAGPGGAPAAEATPNASAHSSPEEADEEVVWPEMAETFVAACVSLEEARRILAGLTTSGVPLDDLRARLDQVWEGKPGDNTKMKFVSPTNEELAAQFVVDCGGYEQAMACLDAYAEDLSERPDDLH